MSNKGQMKNKRLIITAVAISGVIGIFAWKKLAKRPINPVGQAGLEAEKNSSQSQAASYWTCPMHPQIHSPIPGSCPICHMPLVKVIAQESKQEQDDKGLERGQVNAGAREFRLAGVQSVKVNVRPLEVHLPISGRFLSSQNVAFQVYEQDLSLLKVGTQIRGRASMNLAQALEGKITSFDSLVDPSSRTVRATAQMSRGHSAVLSESTFFGEAIVQLGEQLAIPEEAVVHAGKHALVYKLVGNHTLAPTKVELGVKAQNYYQVLSGLVAGEEISSGPNFLLDSESKIRGAQ